MSRLTAIRLWTLSKALGQKGMSLVEISIAMGIGSVAVLVMGQQMQSTMKSVSTGNLTSSFTTLSNFVSSSLMTRTGCAVALGIMDPQTKAKPSWSAINPADAPEPSPITFPGPTLTDPNSLTALPLLATMSKVVGMRNSQGTVMLEAGKQYGDAQITASQFSILSSVPIVLSDNSLAMQGEFKVSATIGKVSRDIIKSLALKIVFIQISGSPELTIKVVGCSSGAVMTEGASVSRPTEAKSTLVLSANTPDGAGGLRTKQVGCRPGYYVSAYDAVTGAATCTAVPGCSSGEGTTLVWLTSGSLSVPACKKVACPAGKMPTAMDSDGFIASCADNSNFFIPCSVSQSWHCVTDNGPIHMEQSYKCDAQAGQLCTENCSTKQPNRVEGCPLNGQTYTGVGTPPTMTTDCTAAKGFTASDSVKVTVAWLPGGGKVEVNRYFCRKDGDGARCPGNWSTQQTHWKAKTCGGNVKVNKQEHGPGECYCLTYCPGGGSCGNHAPYCWERCNSAGYNNTVTVGPDLTTGTNGSSLSASFYTECTCKMVWQIEQHWNEVDYGTTASCTPDTTDQVWCY